MSKSRKSKIIVRRESRKPLGYWSDFANVATELLAFIAEKGTPGIMPTEDELRDAGQSSLASAVNKHGGPRIVAERLGLQRKAEQKPRGYWEDFATVQNELLTFVKDYGTSGIMPTQKDLIAAGRGDLVKAIGKHGGFSTVADRIGLARPSAAKARGYWDNFDNLRETLQPVIAELGRMPTAKEIMAQRQFGLIHAIDLHGGFREVAQKLEVQAGKRVEDGYWDNFENVKQILQPVIIELGRMPSRKELGKCGLFGLANAIAKHGGYPAVAQRLSLKSADERVPLHHWDDFDNVRKALQPIIAELGRMPSNVELKERNLSGLATAVYKHGGLLAVAEKLGVKSADSRLPLGYWGNLSNIEQALRPIVAELGRMPTSEELKDRGLSALGAAQKHGGYPAVAKQLGVSPATDAKPAGYWEDFAHLEDELRPIIAELGRMPTYGELNERHRQDLTGAITKHGGYPAVAEKLGVRYADWREHVTPRAASSVERTAHAIQPLAESNLLSPAQIMVILRRAGLLEFRNQRVVKLGASLARGDHTEIESAIANLVSGGEEIATETVTIEERDDLTVEEAEALLGSDLDTSQASPPLKATTAPDVDREAAVIRGLSALGELRLPLEEVLSLLTSKVLWQEFYKRLYAWYGSLDAAQIVTAEDVEAAILAAYPEHTANEFVAEASALFTVEVEQAVNFAAMLPDHGWSGPRLRLHQADAARRMTDVLGRGESRTRPDTGDREGRPYAPFLLDADDPGMGKSASFLAAVAVSDVRSVFLVAPKTVADDTWISATGEIRRCLPQAHIVRGVDDTLKHSADPKRLTFFVLHYEELLNEEKVAALAERSFDCLCLDEIHFIKQRAGQDVTRRREALEGLRAVAHTAIGLTGTPLVNELAEPMSLLQTLSQHAPQFDHSRLSNRRLRDIADVFEALLPHVIRRRKAEVLLHLPDCEVRAVDIPQPDDLEARMLDIYAWPKSRASNALVELRKLATEAKLPYLQVRAQAARKLLILTYLTDDVSERIAAYLEEFMPRQVAHINGLTSKAEREKRLKAFRSSDKVSILVGTIGTIGVGLTLFDPKRADTANEIIVADLPYTWAEFEQGIARLHREGQRLPVTVEVLQTTTTALLRDGSAHHTLDERIWALIEGKRELSDVAIDGKYDTTDAAAKVQKALRRWLQQAREVGVEPLAVERRSTVQSEAQKWRGEIGRLRGLSAAHADEVFADPAYTHQFLAHLETSAATQLSHQWLRGKLALLMRSDLNVVDMGCGLNPFADLPCRVIGLDRHDRPGQLRGKMENPPLLDRSADVLIYSLSLYGTADDLLAYFTHTARILRGGGHLFIVEPATAFSEEGLKRFVVGLHQFGFELVGSAKELRGEDGTLLKALHLTLTGETGKPVASFFERK